jgi:hypothetical protein
VPDAAGRLVVKFAFGAAQALLGQVSQRGHAELAGGTLARGPPVGVAGGTQVVVHLRVDHEQRQAGRRQAERVRGDRPGAGVGEQHRARDAEGGGKLVERAAGDGDIAVLGPLRQAGEGCGRQVHSGTAGEGEGGRAFQSRRRGQARADWHRRGDRQVRAAERGAVEHSGLEQRPGDARRIGRPVALRQRGERVERHLGHLAAVGVRGGGHAQQAVGARGGGDRGVAVDRHGDREAFVVIGVLANDIHPAGRRPHPGGRCGRGEARLRSE